MSGRKYVERKHKRATRKKIKIQKEPEKNTEENKIRQEIRKIYREKAVSMVVLF